MTQKRATQTESRTKAKPAALKDDELEAVSGGPTEELFGNYHFLLEVRFVICFGIGRRTPEGLCTS